MKINAINSFNYVQNKTNRGQKSQSFGNLVFNKSYKNDLVDNNSEAEIRQVAALSKESIDLKQMLGYDYLSPEKKAKYDELIAVMPEKEVNNLTIGFDIISDYKFVYNSRISQYHIYDDLVYLDTKLPVYNQERDKVRYQKVDLGSSIRHISESKYEAKVGHVLELRKQGITMTDKGVNIPSHEIFDVIGEKLRKHFDDILEQKAEKDMPKPDKSEIKKQEQERRKSLMALFD